MKIKKRDYILHCILIIGMLFIVTSCKNSNSSTSTQAPTTPFLGGTKGLELSFLDGAPPDEVADGGTFPFQAVVSLYNEGEYDLKKNQVKVDVIGFSPTEFGVSSGSLNDKSPADDPTPRIRDSEGNIIDPIETFVTFPSENDFFNFNGQITGNTVFIFRADVCYKYQTKAVAKMCVLRNLVDTEKNALCNAKETKKIFSSASPITVNSFRQTVVGQNKISFSFDIVHNGDGTVFKEENPNNPDCPKDPRERRLKEGYVKVTVDTGLNNLRCIGLESGTTGNVKLTNNKRTITCTQDLDPNRNDFEKNVDITLDFSYLDNIDQEVLVKHLTN